MLSRYDDAVMLDSQDTAAHRRSRSRAAAVASLVGSIVLHGVFYFLLGVSPRASLSLPIVLPVEMELGIGEAAESELGGNAVQEGRRSEVPNKQGQAERTKVTTPRKARAQPRAEAVTTVAGDETASAAASVDTGVGGDEVTADAGVQELAGSGTADDGPVGPRRGVGGGSGSGFGVGGALLAVRIDGPNVRASALILEAEALLALIPGWQRMFAGSGLRPLQHFSRFVIASPNLHPSRLAMAARLRGGIAGVERLTQRMTAHGPLRQTDGLTVGTWSARGETSREVALIDDRTFAIARAQDLQRLLSLARVLGGQSFVGPELDTPLHTGLFQMGETEALSLSVHHVAAFVRTPTPELPKHLRLSLEQPTQLAVQLHVVGQFDTEQRAESALARWRQWYALMAASPEVAALGLVGAIEHTRFELVASEIHVRTQLTMAQLRYLLGMLRDIIRTLAPSGDTGRDAR